MNLRLLIDQARTIPDLYKYATLNADGPPCEHGCCTGGILHGLVGCYMGRWNRLIQEVDGVCIRPYGHDGSHRFVNVVSIPDGAPYDRSRLG